VAVKVGELLAGHRGTCQMHTVQLVIEHATGRRVRKKFRRVYDSFPECEKLRKKAKEHARYLMDKKAKSRWKSYEEFQKGLKRECRKLIIPNDTRSAGVALMYQSLIKNRYNLLLYYQEYKEFPQIQTSEFRTYSEIESILYPMTVLIRQVQTNKFGANSYSFILRFRTFLVYAFQKKWFCADTSFISNNQPINQWMASAKFPKQTYYEKISGLNEGLGVVRMI
jgi:hypothetical protein